MYAFRLPDLGEGVAEGELLAWHVRAGEHVEEDDLLAEVETDKAAVEVPSPVAGVVQSLAHGPGDVIQVGEVLIEIDPDEERAAEAVENLEPAETTESGASDDETDREAAGDETSGGPARTFAPPSVRRLARELDVALESVAGSGPDGRITEGDVRAAAMGDDETGDESADEERDLKSAVSRVEGGDDGESDSGESDGAERDLKSAVRRVGGDESDSGDEGESEDSAVASAVSRVESGGRDRTLATPATRRLARELGVDVDAVPTDQTREGQPYVDEATVRAYAAREGEAGEPQAAPAGTEPQAAESGAADEASERPEHREPYRSVRRSVGEQMARSRREVPHATHYDSVAVPDLVAARERLRPLAEERGVHLTYTPFVLKAVVAALEEHPVLNTELDAENEEIVYKEYYDLGVATATDAGLVVPVVRNVDGKGLLELAADLADLVGRARDRDLAREEMQDSTFTITNFGAIGGEYADPIINVPNTAILGLGAIEERPVARDGEVVAEPTLPLSLAIDHRVIDGADAARFVNTLAEYLADPRRLLL
ncbi:MAG: 2-oxo acid dehydrogenase subunit E2 [Haloarculaceae archaeon]